MWAHIQQPACHGNPNFGSSFPRFYLFSSFLAFISIRFHVRLEEEKEACYRLSACISKKALDENER